MNIKTIFAGVLVALIITSPVLLVHAATTKSTNQAVPFKGPETIDIPAGKFIFGSDQKEREYGYRLDEKAYGHSTTRKQGWYANEPARKTISIDGFTITKNLISNALYQQFLSQTGYKQPFVSKKEWAGYGLIHPYKRAQRFNWHNGKPPVGMAKHPVVLVSFADANAFAKWLSKKTGKDWQLPSEKQWVKAARGTDGRYFPWGNKFDPRLLNSHDNGPFSTIKTGTFTAGASPYGVLDMAGQVFEWTRNKKGNNRHIVKGGSWDDKGCGVCRIAARHTRPDHLKHILVGFRLVRSSAR